MQKKYTNQANSLLLHITSTRSLKYDKENHLNTQRKVFIDDPEVGNFHFFGSVN